MLTCDDNGVWTANAPSVSPLAHESGDALASIMGTHPRPEIPGLLPDIHAYEKIARSGRGDSPEARQLKARLDKAGFEFNNAEQALFDFMTNKKADS